MYTAVLCSPNLQRNYRERLNQSNNPTNLASCKRIESGAIWLRHSHAGAAGFTDRWGILALYPTIGFWLLKPLDTGGAFWLNEKDII
jgi:hypothetical protein